MRISTITVLSVLALSVGCSSMQRQIDKATLSMKTSLDMIPAVQCTAFWEPAVRHDPSLKKPERGFAGRVYFYGNDIRMPVKIKDGHVVVYAFDEEGRAVSDNAPTRSYVFTMDEMKKLYKKSKIGHSYNLWVPWDTESPDGDAKKVSLIVKFVPEKGSSVISSQAKVYLSGRMGEMRLAADKASWDTVRNEKNEIQQVAYMSRAKRLEKEEADAWANRPRRMQTTTFAINGPLANTVTSPSAPVSSSAPSSAMAALPQPFYGNAYHTTAYPVAADTYGPPSQVEPQQKYLSSSYEFGQGEYPAAPREYPSVMPPYPAESPTAYPNPGTAQAGQVPTGRQFHYERTALRVPAGQAAPQSSVPWHSEQPLLESRSTPAYRPPVQR